MKIKRVIEIEESDLDLMKKTTLVEDTNTMLHQTAEDRAKTLMMLRFADAIAQSKPYDDSGDCISRSELMKAIGTMVEAEMPIDKKWALGLKYSLKIIDNAPTVESSYNEGHIDGYMKAEKDYARPQGEWIYKNDLPCCPFCNHFYTIFSNFCPNCGAELRSRYERS